MKSRYRWSELYQKPVDWKDFKRFAWVALILAGAMGAWIGSALWDGGVEAVAARADWVTTATWLGVVTLVGGVNFWLSLRWEARPRTLGNPSRLFRKQVDLWSDVAARKALTRQDLDHKKDEILRQLRKTRKPETRVTARPRPNQSMP